MLLDLLDYQFNIKWGKLDGIMSIAVMFDKPYISILSFANKLFINSSKIKLCFLPSLISFFILSTNY